MELLILLLTAVFFLLLAGEEHRARANRKRLSHVVYVNGTRGKSTVSRLIDAGLRAGGLKVFCKTTGTLPMTIGVDGKERLLVRRGKANIKEQLQILGKAAAEGAQVLVCECMAVAPELQAVSQHRMMRADLGVITNARLDHTDEMGQTVAQICQSLCSTIPKNGVLFTADAANASIMQANADRLQSEFVLAQPDGETPVDLDFPENVALALAVCKRLGVDREQALAGMRTYQKDPYALSLFTLSGGALFINGLSINDPQSSEAVWHMLCEKHDLSQNRLILLINNRPDRGYRTEHMLMLAQRLFPDEVWLMGAFRGVMRRRLLRHEKPPVIRCFEKADSLPLWQLDQHAVLFAAGNIANQGHALMTRVKKEATEFVS